MPIGGSSRPGNVTSEKSVEEIVELMRRAQEIEDAAFTSAEAEFSNPVSVNESPLGNSQEAEKALEAMRQRSLERMRQIREKSKQRPSASRSSAPRPFGPDANIGSGQPGSANSGSGASDPFKTVDEIMKRQAESQKQFEKSVEQSKKNLNPFDSIQLPITRPKSLQDPFGNKPYGSRDRSGKWGKQ